MITLIVDTSNQYLVVALYKDNECIEVIQEASNRKQSEVTIVYIQNLLSKHQLQMLDVNTMVITIGPGSYTGVRVAMTIAKVIGATTNIQIKTVSSLQAFVGTNDGLVILDARSKKVFVGHYEKNEKKEQLMTLEQFENEYQNTKLKIYGDTKLINQPEINVNLAQNIFELSQNSKTLQEVDGLVPVYLKDVEAKKIC